MKNLTLLLGLLISTSMLSAQTITGIWKTVDDEDNVEKSHIKLYEQDGVLYGEVIKLLEGATATHCNDCDGDLKGAPIVGMNVVYDMTAEGQGYDNGSILDPGSGKVYSCSINLKDANTLEVRGYIGFSWLGRTQYWYRVQ